MLLHYLSHPYTPTHVVTLSVSPIYTHPCCYTICLTHIHPHMLLHYLSHPYTPTHVVTLSVSPIYTHPCCYTICLTHIHPPMLLHCLDTVSVTHVHCPCHPCAPIPPLPQEALLYSDKTSCRHSVTSQYSSQTD